MKKKLTRHIAAVIVTLIVYAVLDYIFLPVYNIRSTETWMWITLAIFGFGVLDMMLQGGMNLTAARSTLKGKEVVISLDDFKKKKGIGKISVILAFVIAAVGLICVLLSSPVFHAKSYASIAGNIENRDFIADIPPSETISDIALMDTDSARIIGARAMGSLNELVSQFEINNNYTQINLNSKPMKVAPLEYADFFKWWTNKSEGIPGYVKVDPVLNTSDYVKLDDTMKYSASAFFGENLMRKLRFEYRTAIFGNTYFEIDENGTPFYITPVLKREVFLFGGSSVKAVITLNPCTGETAYYDSNDVPSWIDIVYDGGMLTERYDWYGIYNGGYWNSIFGNKDCKQVTDDYGYKMFDDDVWVFTGVTSVVSDESNIGFVLMNSRTAEIRYYPIPGAEEYSVMASAEGEVQHLGYTASFPSVINVEDQPTYIMALKDKGGLVKQYALTHVERYNIVVTAETQQEVISKYKTALTANGMTIHSGIVSGDSVYEDYTVSEISYLVHEGDSYAYIVTTDGDVLKILCAQFEKIVLVKPGDKLSAVTAENDHGIFDVFDIEFNS